jgi:MYXO-CTERM domain-containing protein
MKSTLFSLAVVAVWAAGVGMAQNAAAQGTWQLGGASCNPGSGTPNTAACAVGSVTATMTAWGGSGSSFTQATMADYDPSGFGAKSGTNETGNNGHHAFDNLAPAASAGSGGYNTGCGTGTATSGCGGTQEFMLISFGNAKVNLNALSIGYFHGDAEISVYRWDGSSGPAGTSGYSGWTLVAAKDMDSAWNSGTSSASFNVNTEANTTNGIVSNNASQLNKYSSWWMISTYAGGFSNTTLGNLQGGAWKLQTFAANLCVGTLTGGSSGGGSAANNNNGATCSTGGGGAPEPGSLALAGLAMVGVLATRRRLRPVR